MNLTLKKKKKQDWLLEYLLKSSLEQNSIFKWIDSSKTLFIRIMKGVVEKIVIFISFCHLLEII